MVVGGLTTLAAMEKVLVDDDDRPLEEIKIINIKVFVNPYTEPDEEDEKAAVAVAVKDDDDDDEKHKVGSWFRNPATAASGNGALVGGVGKYLKSRNISSKAAEGNNTGIDPTIKKRKVEASTVEYKNFSGW